MSFKKQSASAGFTLIELLVSLGIIVTILAMSLAGISSARIRSRDAKRIADLRTIQSALEQHALGDASHTYPPSEGANSADPTTGGKVGDIPTDYCGGVVVQSSANDRNGIYGNSCFNSYLSVTPVGPKGELYQYERPACLVAGTTPGSSTLSRVYQASDCTGVFNGSYGLHVLLESSTNPESKNDSSPTDGGSYDLMP